MHRPVPLPPGYAMREFQIMDLEGYPGWFTRLRDIHPDPDGYVRQMADDPSYTVFRDGGAVASGGVILLHYGNATVWFIPTDDVRKHPKIHLALARQMLHVVEETFKLWRIEATCDVQDRGAANWLEHLSFKPCGIKHSYIAPGVHHLEYERVREP